MERAAVRRLGPEPGASRPGRPAVRVALDATPLLGARSGVGAFTACALGALAARPDLDVLAFAVSWRRRPGIVGLVPPGVTVVDRPMPARPVQAAWRVAPGPTIEWWTGRLDVVHGTNFVVPPARRAARVVTVHDLTAVRFPELCQDATRRYPALIRRALAQGAFVHTPSEFVAHEVMEYFGVSADRVQAVYHGIPGAESPGGGSRTADRVDDGLDGGVGGAAASAVVEGPGPGAGRRRSILAVGTVEPRKDYPTLVRAFDALASGRPDLRLVIVGADGWGVEPLEAALVDARHRDRVIRMGWVSDSRRDALLRAATVLAYPSIYEGFGLPPLEAMAAGVPVVATAAGALPEILGDGATLVPVGDVDALAASLAALLDDEAARTELVGRGHRRTARFSWQACAEGLTGLYRAALAARR